MERTRLDVSAAAEALTDALAQTEQPRATFQAFDEALSATIGRRLFTVLAWRPETGRVERLHTSRPEEYPLAGRKPMGPTPWGARVLKQGLSWFGSSAEDIRWAFPDHELIASLGCASCLNVPVRFDGKVLGAISVLDAEGCYEESDLQPLARLSGFLVAPILAVRA